MIQIYEKHLLLLLMLSSMTGTAKTGIVLKNINID